MLTKSKTISLVLITSILFIGSCKKYEENPLINLRSKTNRLKGGYSLVGYFVNGIDSTVAMNNLLITPYNEKFGVDFSIYEGEKLILGNGGHGIWSFADHKKMLRIDMDNYSYTNPAPFITHEQLDWDITKLTDNHIHLKVNFHGSEYIVQLQQN